MIRPDSRLNADARAMRIFAIPTTQLRLFIFL